MLNDPTEEWRPAPGFEGRYSVSSLGRVRRDLTGRIRKPRPDRLGYLLITLSRDGTKRHQRTHRVATLVAESFLGPRPPKLEVNHKDGVKANNRPENLEWVTRSRNVQHAWEMSLRDGRGATRGMRNGRAKLTDADVLAIRASTESQRALGRRYGVTHETIGTIKRRQHWKHL